MNRTTELYKKIKQWRLERANEYLIAFMEEMQIEDPAWVIDKVKNIYLIVNSKTGRVLKNYGYTNLNALIDDIHEYGWTYKIEMNRKAA